MVLLCVGSVAHSDPMKLGADSAFKNCSGLPLDAQSDGNGLVSEWISQMLLLARYGNKFLPLSSHILDDGSGSVPRTQVDRESEREDSYMGHSPSQGLVMPV